MHLIILRFDGEKFETYFSTQHSHGYTYGVGSNQGQPFTTGSYNDHSKTEIMDLVTLRWKSAPDYPFRS